MLFRSEQTVAAIMVTNEHERIIQVNRAFIDITGYSEEEVLGKTPRILHSGQQDVAFYQQFWKELNEQGVWRGELWNCKKDGTPFPVRETISKVKEGSAKGYYISVFSDISNEKKAAAYIDKLSHYDSLTNLPNRSLFHELCEHAIIRAERMEQRGAILYIDLDRFKHINDSLGHAIGDKLLQLVSTRLHTILRADDIVARLGGDEFTILLEQFGDLDELTHIAGKVLDVFGNPFEIKGYSLHMKQRKENSIFPDNAHDA